MNIDKIDLLIPSPIEHVRFHAFSDRDITLNVKREDKIHPLISGNKWRKLKFNLQHLKTYDFSHCITFGGPFSNHIYATAAACALYNIPSIGIIRGEYDSNNPTLKFAQEQGMKLHFVSRTAYRAKEDSEEVKTICSEYSNPYIIPEGGSNHLAIDGLKELADEINTSDYDIILVSAGTGFTAGGILKHLDQSKDLWVFSSLNSDYLKDEILDIAGNEKAKQLLYFKEDIHGGYGKTSPTLIEFINDWKKETSIPIDPIYNGKLLYRFIQEMNRTTSSSKYLWIHTGGLQGIDAYNYLANKKSKPLIL